MKELKELIQDIDREEVMLIAKDMIGWAGLGVIAFMISVIGG